MAALLFGLKGEKFDSFRSLKALICFGRLDHYSITRTRIGRCFDWLEVLSKNRF
ncbi:Hypothetical protein P9211_06271 [Prochlorococcus marinus str. MIT 9211]|uniref:Uncharacterized protein n=1 Tax=Prochlorococcus marinus (strain MIT 9211) TaxID=93059 RepID=A9B9P6_PROM4|nr:Hypothetical protein P9211_06271 [Prochlorococcus marinus str. MIT 9211]